MGCQRTDRQGAQRVGGVLAAAGGRHIVGLVHDEQVELARIGWLVGAGQHFAKQAHGALALEEIDRGDQAREVGPGVDVKAALAATQLQVPPGRRNKPVKTIEKMSPREIDMNYTVITHAGRALALWRGKFPAQVVLPAWPNEEEVRPVDVKKEEAVKDLSTITSEKSYPKGSQPE